MKDMALIDVSSYLAVTILAAETEPICAELLEARAEDTLLRPLVRCYPASIMAAAGADNGLFWLDGTELNPNGFASHWLISSSASEIKVPRDNQVSAPGRLVTCGLGVSEAGSGVRPISGGSLQEVRHSGFRGSTCLAPCKVAQPIHRPREPKKVPRARDSVPVDR